MMLWFTIAATFPTQCCIIIVRWVYILFFAYRKILSRKTMTLETVHRLIKLSRYYPAKGTQRSIRKQYPDIQFEALTIRLIKYTLEGKTYYIGTTLIDERYTIEALKDLYHAREGIEELGSGSNLWF